MANYEWPEISTGETVQESSDGRTIIFGGSGDSLLDTNVKLVNARRYHQSFDEAEKRDTAVVESAIEILTLEHLTIESEQGLQSFKEFLNLHPDWKVVVTVDGTSTKVKRRRHKAVLAHVDQIKKKYEECKVEVKMA